jgi:hypothetical protein
MVDPRSGRSPRGAAPANQSAESIFTSTLDSIAAVSDCSEFLSRSRTFGSAIVLISLHPCYRKAGEEAKVIKIGCSVQGGDGVKITPEFEYQEIENQCPGANSQRLSSTSYTIEVGINEIGMARDELFGLLWSLGTPEASGTYSRQKFGLPIGELPIYVVSVQPIGSGGTPTGIFTFYRAQWAPDSAEIVFGKGESPTSTIKFMALFDASQGAIGEIATLTA